MYYIGGDLDVMGNSFDRTEERGLDVMGLTGLGNRIYRLSATRLRRLSFKYQVRSQRGTGNSHSNVCFFIFDQNESVFALAMGNSFKQFSQL